VFDVTYAGQLDAAVAALGSGAALLDVKNTVLAAGGLDHPRLVRRGVVAADFGSVDAEHDGEPAAMRRSEGRKQTRVGELLTGCDGGR
jgi:hypothetical protein